MRFIIFTDLDGTLLDHSSYDWSPAATMLHKLETAAIPVIYTTSKTLAELTPFQYETGNRHPAIAENGGAFSLPQGWLDSDSPAETGVTAASRDELRTFIDSLPFNLKTQVHGFSQMGDEGVAEATGLPLEKAKLANNRQCSEPFLWRGGDEGMYRLTQLATDAGFHILRGGRFYHLQSKTDKKDAMTAILSRLAAIGKHPASIALGDGPNDVKMLEAADIAISIPNRRGASMSLSATAKASQQRLIAPEPGPAGWTKAIASLDLV